MILGGKKKKGLNWLHVDDAEGQEGRPGPRR